MLKWTLIFIFGLSLILISSHYFNKPIKNQVSNSAPPIASGVVAGQVKVYSTSSTQINLTIATPKGQIFLIPVTNKTSIISHNPRIVHDLTSFSSYMLDNNKIVGMAGVNSKGITDDLIVTVE